MADDQVKTIEEWEKQRGAIFTGDNIDIKREVTNAEFSELLATEPYTGLDYQFRIEWLQKNGYEVTRENLVNSDLPTKSPEDDEEEE